MPEIAEVARLVGFLKKHAVGRIIAAVQTQEDDIVYGKVGTSASAFEKAMTGKKIVNARQQGKYFWLEMESPPHPLMHLGMNGWVKLSNADTSYNRKAKPSEPQWPPRYWKFALKLEGEPKCEVAYVDGRRLGRIRLVEAAAADMRKTSPLKENGPDPVIDKDILTVPWLTELLRRKKVPVKALLLDQGNISGIGNWVGDEIMYQACLHPEQYSNTFSDEQIARLHKAMMYVCDTAVELNAESDRFPKDWLMKHRWTQGKATTLPNGEKVTFLKVGGRTSAVVLSRQKKTVAVAGDVSDDAEEEVEVGKEETKPKKGKKRESKKEPEDDGNVEPVHSAKPKRSHEKVKAEDDEDKGDEQTEAIATPAKKQKVKAGATTKGKATGKANKSSKKRRI